MLVTKCASSYHASSVVAMEVLERRFGEVPGWWEMLFGERGIVIGTWSAKVVLPILEEVAK